MKKILLISSILVVSTLSFNSASAQTVPNIPKVSSSTQSFTVATVNIHNAKIVSQKDRDFVLSFDISNTVGKQSEVKYAVQLMQVSSKNEFTVDEKVYPETLSLGENVSVNKTINYSVPNSLPAGTYKLYIESKNGSGLMLAVSYLGSVKIASTVNNTVQIVPNSCSFALSSGTSTFYQYASMNPADVLTAKCKVSSTFSNDVVVTPSFTTRYATVFGDTVLDVVGGSSKPVTLHTGDNEVSFELPKAEKPQSYNLTFSLVSDDKTISSNEISLNYALVGQSGTIQNEVFDKSSYKAGETANIQLFSTLSLSTTSVVTVTVFNDSGVACSDRSVTEILPNVLVSNIKIPIKSDCANPKANIVLSVMGDDGKYVTLDSKNSELQATSSTSSGKISPTIGIALMVLIVILLIIVLRLAFRRKNDSTVIKTLAVLVFAASMFFGLSNTASANTNVFTYTEGPYSGGCCGLYISYYWSISVPDYVNLGESVMVTSYVSATHNTFELQPFTQSIQISVDGSAYQLGAVCNSPNIADSPGVWNYMVWQLGNCVSSYVYVPFTPTQSVGSHIVNAKYDWTFADEKDHPFGSGYDSSSKGCDQTYNDHDCWLAYVRNNIYSGTAYFSIDVSSIIAASPNPVASGATSSISWSSTNASSCSVTKNGSAWKTGLSNVGTSSGSLSGDTLFEVTCVNGSYSTSSSIMVYANPDLPIISLSAAPSTVDYNAASTLSWTTSNASSCTASSTPNKWSGSKTPNNSSSTSITALTADTVFELRCTNTNGTSASTTSVNVRPGVPTSFTGTYAACNTINLAWTASPNTTAYQVYRDGVLATTSTITGTTYSDVSNSILSGHTYAYQIRSLKNGLYATSSIVNVSAVSNITLDSTITGTFSIPMSVAVDNQNNFWITDQGDDTVRAFSSTSDTQYRTSGSIGLTDPMGIAVDSNRDIYVVDNGHDRFVKLASTTLAVILSKTGGLDGFSNATDIAVDSSGNIYVVDAGNRVVQKFNSAGTYQSQFGPSISGYGEMSPRGIAIDSSNNIWIADIYGHQILKLNSSGAYILSFGTYGGGVGQLSSPYDISIDSSGNIIVADYGNYKVAEFSPSGTFLKELAGVTFVNGPTGIAVNKSNGKVYVTGSGYIQKLDLGYCSGGAINTGCLLSQTEGPLSGGVYLNKKMTWTMPDVPGITGATSTWSGTGILSTIQYGLSGISLDKIYTTVGSKAINATTTGYLGEDPYTTTCSATTTVIMEKGSQGEI
ncbi:MAG: NHL repeat-containing protein [Candidatus Paceibacterota bacterium]|jgi:DNA-binding beta-propeller fold protein YncE